MQPLKDRPGRLQMFARLAAEAASPHATSQNVQGSPERFQEAPAKSAAPISALERQELAEIARLPIPKPIRQSLGRQGGNGHPQLDAQRRHHSASPARQSNGLLGGVRDPHCSELFNGSQLGDSFMNSGITTPHNEPEDPEPELVSPREKKKNVVSPPTRGNFDRGLRPGNNASFQIGDDLLMKVVTGPRRHNPSHMNDGFHNGAINGQSNENTKPYAVDYGRSGSPARRHPILPVGQAQMRNSHPVKHDQDKRPASPAFDTNTWQRRFMAGPTRHPRFLEPDDDSTSTVHGAVNESPRAKRANGSPVRDHQVKPLTLTELLSQPTLDKKRRRPTLDYDDMALNNMNYMDLHNEPFDFDPSTATPHAGHGAGGANLSAKLEQYRHQPDKEQRFLFRSLSIDDWEAAGDWFADQYLDIMQRLKEARQDKRRMIKDFEDEAAAREEAVRLRSESIDRKLSRMRQDGQRVVAANEFPRQDGH